MNQYYAILLSALVIPACSTAQPPQAGLHDEESALAGVVQRCAAPVSPQPTWWHDGATGAHFGCSSAYNAALQDLPPAPAGASGTDSIIAVSAVRRYRKGQDKPLREPSLDVGTPAQEAR